MSGNSGWSAPQTNNWYPRSQLPDPVLAPKDDMQMWIELAKGGYDLYMDALKLFKVKPIYQSSRRRRRISVRCPGCDWGVMFKRDTGELCKVFAVNHNPGRPRRGDRNSRGNRNGRTETKSS